MSVLNAKELAKVMRATVEKIAADVYGEFTFDVSEPRYGQIFPAFATTDSSALMDMWRVKFGEGYVSQYDLSDGPIEWRCIAHELWKRKEIIEITVKHPLTKPGTANNDINTIRGTEKRYVPQWK